jgi:hypothetical protein
MYSRFVSLEEYSLVVAVSCPACKIVEAFLYLKYDFANEHLFISLANAILNSLSALSVRI